jgi:4-amino-4-deoxy-L-arabinose transferase-like glycosyltransferase
LAWPVVAGLAVTKVAFQLVTSALYGAHRDEFYYLESGYHLAWGYVDNPPMTPVLDRIGVALFGHSVTGLHVIPAVLGGTFVVLAAVLAREVGGGRFAQGLAGLVATIAPLFLTTSHFLGTVSLDLVFWGLASLLLMRLVRANDARWWLAIGLVVGVGLLNKDSMVLWALGATVGLALTPERRFLRSWSAVGGAAIAAVIYAPNLVWEVQHHWPTLEFLRHLQADHAGTDRTQFLPTQLLATTPAGTVVWVVALIALVRDPRWRAQRWLAAGYAVLFVFLLASGGKGYYLGPWYVALVAVGAAEIERRWTHRARVMIVAAVALTGLLGAPAVTPILPRNVLVSTRIDRTNGDMGAMLGWPHVVDEVAEVYRRLPPDERPDAKILTSNYSQAGAIDFYGPARGLPAAISGHNNFWWWGFGRPTVGTVIAVGVDRSFLERYWTDCHQDAVLGSGAVPVDPEERGQAILTCRGQKVPWSVIWPAARHYD